MRASKRKRSMVQYYDYDFTALGEKHVDKFRVNTKYLVEKRATNIFVDRHNMVY